MDVLFKRMRKSIVLINGAAGLFPLIILGPFAVMTGFMTLSELIYVATAPIPSSVTLAIIVTGQVMAWGLTKTGRKKIEESGFDWDVVKLWSTIMVLQLFIFIGFDVIVASVLIKYLTPVAFPNDGIITAGLVLAFQLMVVAPLASISSARAEQYVRSGSSKPERVMSIRLKISIIVVSVVLGIVLMFIDLRIISSTNLQMGFAAPVNDIVTILIAGLVGMASLMLALSIMMRHVIGPINVMVESFNKGASGDFRENVSTTTTDEIGVMAVMTNTLMDSLNTGFSTVKGTVGTLQASKDDLSSRVEEMAGSVEEIRQNLVSANNQMEDHSSNVIETTAAVEQLARNIDSLGQHIANQVNIIGSSSRSIAELSEANTRLTELAEQSKDKTDGLVKVSKESEEKLQAMANRISSIMESSRHLMEANEMIAAVASRTNLLAMNAAIEAAHAGEAGRGFAVVADEIRKLAETSASQSSAITANLKEVIGDIERVGDESALVQSSFGQINSHVTGVGEAVEHLNSFTAEVRSFSLQLEEAMGSLNSVSDSVALGSREMQTGNEEILKAITNMREISQRVLEAVNEITIGADEITSLSAGMLDQNRVTDESLQSVMEVLGRFKIRE